MLTRYFSTSKPLHLVIMSILLVVIYIATNFNELTIFSDTSLVIRKVAFLISLLFSFFVLTFFSAKNNLTASTSYKLLFFVLFLAMVPNTMKDGDIILANMFVLMAIRRVISLRTQQETKKKILDAAIWLTIAAICYFWAFLFFAIIFAALLLYNLGNIKNSIIPFIGLIAVAIIAISINLLFTGDFVNALDYILPISFDFSTLNQLSTIVALTIIVSFSIWASFFYLNGLKEQPKPFRSAHFLILLCASIALLIAIVAPNKNGSELLFLAAPFSIILGNYVQSLNEKWFTEVILWICVVIPVGILFLN